MSKPDAVTFVHKVEMRVDLQNVKGLGPVKGVYARNVDRVIAPDNNR